MGDEIEVWGEDSDCYHVIIKIEGEECGFSSVPIPWVEKLAAKYKIPIVRREQ